MHCTAQLLEHGQIHALHCTLTGAWTNSCTALHTYWSMDKFMHCTAHLLEHGQIHALHCTLTGAWTKFMHCTAHLLEHSHAEAVEGRCQPAVPFHLLAAKRSCQTFLHNVKQKLLYSPPRTVLFQIQPSSSWPYLGAS